MQNLLNILLLLAVIIYGAAFLSDLAVRVSSAIKHEPKTVEAAKPTEAVEDSTAISITKPEILLTTVADNTHSVVNPAHKAFDRVTVAQLKAYIAEQNLKESLELQMSKKLYKALKRDIYQALKAV